MWQPDANKRREETKKEEGMRETEIREGNRKQNNCTNVAKR